MRIINEKSLDAVTVAASQASDVTPMDLITVADVTAVITAANPSNGVFGTVTAGEDTIEIEGHGYTTGMKATATTTGTLPAGLATSTDYYVIVVDEDTISLATSQANALAGTAIDITDAGTGDHTLVVTTTIAGSVKLQKSNEQGTLQDPHVWVDIENASEDFTDTETANFALSDVGFKNMRALVTVTSGTVEASVRVNGKGA